MMFCFSLQKLFHFSSVVLFVFTQTKFLPHDLRINSFSSHEGKMHFLNHDIFRLFAQCSRLLSSLICTVFLNAFRVLFSRFRSCFTCQFSSRDTVSSKPLAQGLYYCKKHEKTLLKVYLTHLTLITDSGKCPRQEGIQNPVKDFDGAFENYHHRCLTEF